MAKQTRRKIYTMADFAAIPATGSADSGPFVQKITGAAPPTASLVLSEYAMALTAASQAQQVSIYQDDVLMWDIDDLIKVEYLVRMSVAATSGTNVAFGVGGTRNDTLDSVAQHAWFRLEGNGNIVCETDDGTNDKNDIATGDTLVTTLKRFVIDFSTGIQTISPPSQSKGGKADVHFLMENSAGALRRVASGTLFDMSNYAAGLQLIMEIGKASGTSVGTLNVKEIAVEYRVAP